MSKILNLAEKGFVVFSLLFFTGAITVIVSGDATSGEGKDTLISKAISLVIPPIAMLLIVVWREKVVPIVSRGNFLWALMAIAVASVLWSNVPSMTLSNVINLIRTTSFGVYFAARFNMKEQLRLLAWALGIGALLSLFFAVLLPSHGIMGRGSILTSEEITHAGAWKGVYGHKNVLGRIMVLSTVVFLLVANNSRKYRWITWIGFCLSVSLILASTSKTSLIIFLTIMALLPFYRALRWSSTLAIPFFITVILVGGSVIMLLVSNAESVLGAFGRDLTLTGRTELWATVLDKIWQRPWLGYGYFGFWQGWSGESADVWDAVRWEAPHSHNGFLDLWLDLGLVGLLAFAISFFGVCFQAVKWVRQTKTPEGLWPLAYLTFLLLANVTESSFFRQNSLWILYVAVTLSLHNKSENPAKFNVGSQRKVKGRKMQRIIPESRVGRV